MTMPFFEKISEEIADREQTFALINRGYSPDQRKSGQWFETTEEIYDYFLGVLPPLDWTTSGFSMREFATDYLTDSFVNFGERYFCLTIHRERRSDFINIVSAFHSHLATPIS